MPATALLVIDLQLGMFDGAQIAPIHDGPGLLARVAARIAQARQDGMRILYIRHANPPGDLLEAGTQGWHIHPAIAPLPGETIIDKRHPDAFQDTTLLAELQAAGITHLTILGAQTEYCVDTTCRRAASLGLHVTLVADCHSTWDNKTLTAPQIIAHTNQTLAGSFVTLAN
jgi:nicotinamidase-related amidase